MVETVKAQHEKARRLLAEHRSKLDELAKYLYEKETITGEQFMGILENGLPEEKPAQPAPSMDLNLER